MYFMGKTCLWAFGKWIEMLTPYGTCKLLYLSFWNCKPSVLLLITIFQHVAMLIRILPYLDKICYVASMKSDAANQFSHKLGQFVVTILIAKWCCIYFYSLIYILGQITTYSICLMWHQRSLWYRHPQNRNYCLLGVLHLLCKIYLPVSNGGASMHSRLMVIY